MIYFPCPQKAWPRVSCRILRGIIHLRACREIHNGRRPRLIAYRAYYGWRRRVFDVTPPPCCSNTSFILLRPTSVTSQTTPNRESGKWRRRYLSIGYYLNSRISSPTRCAAKLRRAYFLYAPTSKVDGMETASQTRVSARQGQKKLAICRQ